MSHEDFDALAPVYALGALDGDDRARFELHIAAGCAACESMIREYRETLTSLALADPPTLPPAHVKSALLDRLRATAPRREPVRARRWMPWAVATAAIVVATSAMTAAFVAARYEGRLGQMAREMVAMRERLATEEATLRDQVAVYRGVVELLRDPATQIVALHGAGPNPTATGRVVWHATKGGQLVVTDLPAPPPGKAYEVWTITGKTPRPAGTFGTDAAGKGGRAIEPLPPGTSVDVFAVTLEPEAGVPAPTGPIVLASR